VLLPNLID
jgi:hypothetical protein